MKTGWPWILLFGLGAYHGINPAMGWLFSVALGVQEKSRRGVLRAIPPIALGHLLSIAIVLTLFWLASASVPERTLRYSAATIVFAFALYRLVRSRHPKWVGMQVGFRDLTLWSFLMASAHGAGLMLVPVLLIWPGTEDDGAPLHAGFPAHGGHLALLHGSVHSPLQWAVAAGVHTIGHLSLTILIALLVYEKLGLAVLRRAWFNLDLIWSIALLGSVAAIFLV